MQNNSSENFLYCKSFLSFAPYLSMKEEKLEELALDLFLRYGFRAVTMDRIAEEARVSKKTLYEVFENKSNLVKVCTQRHLEDIMHHVEQSHEQADNAVDEVMRIMSYIHASGDLENDNIADLKGYYPEAFKVFLDYQQNVIKASIIRNIKRGQAEGIFRQDVNAEIMAEYRLATLFYVMDQLKQTLPLDRFMESAQEISNHFLRGLMTEKGHKIHEQLIK